jgi:hypothetical protein
LLFLDYSIKDLDGFVVRYTDLWVFDILTSRICRAKCHVPRATCLKNSRPFASAALWRCGVVGCPFGDGSGVARIAAPCGRCSAGRCDGSGDGAGELFFKSCNLSLKLW